jgi:beta-glucosidase
MDDMKLPANGSQDRLIEAVCAVNPSVVVINSTGGPIEMPWLNKVKAVIQVWFGGQESGNSIVDVLLGTVNPGGKLPMSFPKTLQDSPSYANFPGDLSKLEVDYGEDVFTGYRYFDKSPLGLQFPFGFGLSYTTFEMDVIDVDSASLVPEGKITLQIRVRNTGSRYGSEVVQLYVQKTRCPKEEALKQLSAFKKVNLKPNEQRAVEMSIDQGSAARWDSSEGCWSMDKGLYEIVLATSSAHTSAVINFTVKETYRFGPGNRINARHSCL